MTDQPLFLYVEDEPLSRMVMEMLMTKVLGYQAQEIVILENSAHLLEALEQLPTVIFLDIHVKPFDGFQMLQMVRQHKRFHRVCVIAVTASVMNEEVELLKTSGFNGAIAKPIDLSMFPQMLQEILSGDAVWDFNDS